MKKIISKYEAKKVQKRNSFVVGGILIFLLFSSILGYSFQGRFTGNVIDEENSSEEDILTYNGFEFLRQGEFWKMNNEANLAFSYNPEQVGNGEGISKSLREFIDQKIYISSENRKARLEIKRNLLPFVEDVEDACLEGEECEEGIPIKDCENNFIIIRESNKEEIIQEENCIFISGQEESLVKLADEFLFKILGVKE